VLRWLKTVVVSDAEKAHRLRQVQIRKTVRRLECEFAVEVSLLDQVTSKPKRNRSALGRARRVPADWPGGVRHVGDVSLICRSRTERGKAYSGIASERRREGASQAG
jgi:hypothetical protein